MKFSRIPQGLALAAVLALSSSGAFAASDLHALSESEMSGVYGRGLSDPTLTALTTQGQSGAAVSGTAAGDALSALGALSNDTVQTIDRQMALQHLQNGTTSIQATLKVAQTMAALNVAMAPLAAGLALPLMPFPLLFVLPALPSLDAIKNKH